MRNICKFSIFLSALYAKCPYYVVLYMQKGEGPYPTGLVRANVKHELVAVQKVVHLVRHHQHRGAVRPAQSKSGITPPALYFA